MKAFVSGGAGVIGRELVSRLVSQGVQVIVGDLQPRPQELGEGVEYLHGDLNDLKVWPECDVFYHLAATFERLEESPEHWEKNFRHNVQLSHHLLTLCKAPRVVFASSYLIYGKHRRDGTRENAPRNLTGAAKFYTECEMAALHPNSVSARIYRSYGKGSRDVISRWCRATLNRETVPLYNVETQLDFVYAGDVAKALVMLAASKARGHVEVGTGEYSCIAYLAQLIGCKTVDADIPAPFESSAADVEKLRKLIGWVPDTTVAKGVEQVMAYERGRCVP